MYSSNDRKELGCILVLPTFIMLAILLYYSYTSYFYCGFNPKENQKVKGRIIESKVKKSTIGRGYDYTINYEYFVNRKKYISHRVCCDSSGNAELIEKYPVDKEVVVYYKDSKPSLSVLEPTISRNGLITFYVCGFFFFSV